MTKTIKPRMQRVYLKDVSFEAPDLLKTLSKDWKPEVKLDMNNKVHRLDENVFEVVLLVTASVKSGEALAYVCEVQQAGLFTVEGIDEAGLKKALGCDCPTELFPFAREAIANLVTAGGFPSLLLSPVDFESLYDNAVLQQQTEASGPH